MSGTEVLVAAIVSVVVEIIKRFSKSNGWLAIALAVVVSLAGAAVYAYAQDKNFWPAALRVFTYASAIYAVIISQLGSAKSGGVS